MTIRPAEPRDRDECLRLRRALFPNDPVDQLAREVECYWSGRGPTGTPTRAFVAQPDDAKKLGGFVEISVRPGASPGGCHPAGHVEAWYVEPDLRRQGIGRRLLAAAECWARDQGVTSIGSDCHLDNDVSRAAHLAVGYQELRPLGRFRKDFPSSESRDAVMKRDWIDILPDPIPAAQAVEFVHDADAGGIDVFLGTTRSETNEKGQPLLALDYEAYGEMAMSQMKELARRARERWPVIKLALLHRTGRVPLAQPSVLIAVSTPHRAESFEACRFLIDALKADVTIWKKEVWSDGTGTWVHPQK